MNMIQVLASQLADMRDECDRLKRENSILRSEFKILLVNNNIENYDMSEDAAEEDAEKWLTHLVAHNEGAE
jgi:hypothetical protein